MPSTRLVNGRLPENSPATSTGRSWPRVAFARSRPISENPRAAQALLGGRDGVGKRSRAGSGVP